MRGSSCINGCEPQFSLLEIIYRCPSCGDLLEVQHDLQALKTRSSAAWMQLFDDRCRRNSYPYGSGVWGKKEWVVPFIDNENIVSTYEGNSNLFWADRYGKQLHVEDLWVKQCGNSHTGSFKDLGMTVLVSVVKQMIADGQPIDAVACASTGDTSAALASYCAAAGIPAVVLLPRNKVSPAQLVQPLANGALVLSLDTDFDGCMAVVQEITKHKRIYLANSMNSLRIEGQKTVAIEIVQQFDWEVPDWVDHPGRQPRQRERARQGLPHAAGARVDPEAAPHLRRAGRARQPALPFVPEELRDLRADDGAEDARQRHPDRQPGERATRDPHAAALRRRGRAGERAGAGRRAARADRTGMFNCPHTGVALAALRKLVERKVIRSHERVVVISTAHGLKFADQKTAYHLGTLSGIRSTHQNLPVEIKPDDQAGADAIARHVERARLLEQ